VPLGLVLAPAFLSDLPQELIGKGVAVAFTDFVEVKAANPPDVDKIFRVAFEKAVIYSRRWLRDPFRFCRLNGILFQALLPPRSGAYFLAARIVRHVSHFFKGDLPASVVWGCAASVPFSAQSGSSSSRCSKTR
jgi:hypothetical protein